jgi:hypothetical protein
MPTIEQEQQEHKKLVEVLGALKAINPESLVRAAVLGKDLSFEKGLPVFHRTPGLFHELSECNLENFPYETLNQLWSQANDALTLFQQIQNFSVQQHPLPPIGWVRRQDLEGRQAGRSSDRAAHQVRSCREPENCQSHWRDNSTIGIATG